MGTIATLIAQAKIYYHTTPLSLASMACDRNSVVSLLSVFYFGNKIIHFVIFLYPLWCTANDIIIDMQTFLLLLNFNDDIDEITPT